MTASYDSLGTRGESRYEEKKSVFLGFANPVTTEEEAISFVASIKKQYPDARHHVYAYVLREDNKSRYTDDGEPSGTAGMPVLDILRKQNLTDCVIVVVRYFGGTLLGTGGLVRAYTIAAKEAVENAGIVTWRPLVDLNVSVSYADYQKLNSLLANVTILETQFENDVSIRISLPQEGVDQFVIELTNRTAGRGKACILGERFGF
jgi:uncharacterized YigZ family protein